MNNETIKVIETIIKNLNGICTPKLIAQTILIEIQKPEVRK